MKSGDKKLVVIYILFTYNWLARRQPGTVCGVE